MGRHPVAEDLARQSAFYAAHDRTQDARPECERCDEPGAVVVEDDLCFDCLEEVS